MDLRAAAVVVAFLAAGCGLPSSQTDTSASKTTEALCSDAPRINSDGIATMVGCSFEQHVENVMHHGQALSVAALRDANGVSVNASNECGDWVLAVDSQNVQILVRQSTGEVQSHGTIHAGFPVSTLPARLALPLQLE